MSAALGDLQERNFASKFQNLRGGVGFSFARHPCFFAPRTAVVRTRPALSSVLCEELVRVGGECCYRMQSIRENGKFLSFARGFLHVFVLDAAPLESVAAPW